MAAITLYPPIVDTYMPAFVAEDIEGNQQKECRIYFAISNYNTLGQINDSINRKDRIQSVWVSLVNQSTNVSVVDIQKHPSELIGFNVNEIIEDTSKIEDDKYYITLNADSLIGGQWERGVVYKAQLRFANIPVDSITGMGDILKYQDNFSEWSTICLLQGIKQPELVLNNFSSILAEDVVFNGFKNQIAGMIKFDKADNDFLHSYTIKLYKQSTLEKIYDSGVIYTNSFNPNEIDYLIKCGLEDGVRYILKIDYLSDKLYSGSREFKFLVLETAGGALNVDIKAVPNNEKGRIEIFISALGNQTMFGNLALRRASVKTNYTVWEDVHVFQIIDEEPIACSWADYAIESGVWYKYCVCRQDTYGHMGVATMVAEPSMVYLEDMFLMGEQQQLKIKYNPQISTFNFNVVETSTQTLGSKYPFVKRNANVKYRQFDISGLITYFMDVPDERYDNGNSVIDNERLFIDPEKDLYFNNQNLYDNFNSQNRITLYNNFTLERLFREKVQEFLTDGKVKLFNSATEGLILVKLMNVSFTPEQTLGRMLYNFKATAIEIGEPTLDELNKYKIQLIGSYKDILNYTKEKIKIFSIDDILNSNLVNDSEWVSLLDLLNNQEIKLNAYQDKNIEIKSIDKVSINFESEPYLIISKPNELIKVKNDIVPEEGDDLALGYIIKIDNQDTLVNANGGYIIDNNLISNVYFNINDNAQITCEYRIFEEENLLSTPSLLSYLPIVGQQMGVFNPENNIIYEYLKAKHEVYNFKNYYRLFSINELSIEAAPYTVFYLRDDYRNTYERFQLGDTGFLSLTDNDYFFTGLYFVGPHLLENVNDDYLEYNEFKFVAGELPEDEILVNNHVYSMTIKDAWEKFKDRGYYNNFFSEYLDYEGNIKEDEEGSINVICYQGGLYIFTEDNDVFMPCHAIINYFGEVEKGEFVE